MPGADREAPLVSSIVLNWNRRDETLACLASLAEQQDHGYSQELLLVDNGSTDGSAEAVERALPTVGVIRLPSNLGYAAGMNVGVKEALRRGAEWTFLVNNDAVVEPQALALLIEKASEPDIAIAAPTVYYFRDRDRIWPSAGRRRPLTLAPLDTTAEVRNAAVYDVDWANACCILVRRELWEQVGFFDEGYQFYYEDHDLCLRAQAAGWRIVHVPKAVVRHHVSASTGEGSPAHMYLLARSSIRFYAKHTHGLHRIFIALYRLGSLVRTLTRTVLEGRPASGLAYLRGVLHGLRDVLRPSRADSEMRIK